MPTFLSDLNINLTGDAANKIFLEPIFMDARITDNFTVMPNVVNKRKMAFVGKMEKILRKYTKCGFDPISGFNMYERTIDVERIKADTSLCVDEFLDTIYEELARKGTPFTDLSGTVLSDILQTRYREAIMLDIMRLYFFGDTASGDVEYDIMDGLWTTWIVDLVTANLVPYYNTSSGAPLGAGDGITILRTVWDNAPKELKAMPNKRFYTTGSVWLQYLEDIEDIVVDSARTDMLNGIANVTFRNVPVQPMWNWDDYQEELGSPDSHLCLLSTPSNLIIATDILNPGDDFRIWYDDDEEKVKLKGRFKLGGNYIHPSLMSVGY